MEKFLKRNFHRRKCEISIGSRPNLEPSTNIIKLKSSRKLNIKQQKFDSSFRRIENITFIFLFDYKKTNGTLFYNLEKTAIDKFNYRT